MLKSGYDPNSAPFGQLGLGLGLGSSRTFRKEAGLPNWAIFSPKLFVTSQLN